MLFRSMRTKTLYKGLKNSQKIRIMINGFGFYTKVGDIDNICTAVHRNAIRCVLMSLANKKAQGEKITGFGTNVIANCYPEYIDVQIDLC